MDQISIRFMMREPGKSLGELVVPVKRSAVLLVSVQELIKTGIAVPGDDDSLIFYENCHAPVYDYIPTYFSMSPDVPLWDAARGLFRSIVSWLEANERVPTDLAWPFSQAVKADHVQVMKSIEAFVQEFPMPGPVMTAEDVFDERGVARAGLFERLAFGGCDAKMLPEVMPFVMGVYELTWTREEREAARARLDEQFKHLLEHVALVSSRQQEKHKRLSGNFRVIRHDVERTDRGLPAFAPADGAGLTHLTTMLKAYCVLNPVVGYLQGMNDLFVPLILAHFPDWDDQGRPLKDGEPTTCDSELPMVFWEFARMLDRFGHTPLLQRVTEECQEMARKLVAMFDVVSPLFAAWLRNFSLANMLWMYSDFVLLYKRTCDRIWDLWLQIACSPSPKQWALYFAGGLLLDKVCPLMDASAGGREISITSVMGVFPELVKSVDPARVGRVAMWLFGKCPPEPEPPAAPRVGRGKFKHLGPEPECPTDAELGLGAGAAE